MLVSTFSILSLCMSRFLNLFLLTLTSGLIKDDMGADAAISSNRANGTPRGKDLILTFLKHTVTNNKKRNDCWLLHVGISISKKE